MDGLTIQARINAGRGKAALRIGLDCKQYRPLTMSAPLGNLLRTIKAAFNSGDTTYRSPNLPGDAIWYGDFDGSVTQPGDYLVRNLDGQTFFIAAQQQLLPIICIDCNRTVRMSRTPNTSSVGAVGYGGETNANEVDVFGQTNSFIGWPASILIKGRNEATGTGIPSTTKNAGWQILLPVSMTAQINAGDLLRDDLGRRYAVQAAELTDLGWRLQATEGHT